jgi:hypothetical protein
MARLKSPMPPVASLLCLHRGRQKSRIFFEPPRRTTRITRTLATALQSRMTPQMEFATTPLRSHWTSPPTVLSCSQSASRTVAAIHTPKSKEAWVSEIIHEEDTPENDLPAGYTGTSRGRQHYDPNNAEMLECGYNSIHRLICGHHIESAEPCGSNCKTEQLEQKTFNCATCRNIVYDVCKNKVISFAEATKLKQLREMEHMAFVSRCVEPITRDASQLKCGVTEALMSYVIVNYGRTCTHSGGPPPQAVYPLEDTLREKCARENPLKDPVMRKAFEEALNLPTIPQRFELPVEVQDEHKNKEQKTKLESHKEPVTDQTCGTKRPSPNYNDTEMPDASEPASKKQKTKHTPPAPRPSPSSPAQSAKFLPQSKKFSTPQS